MKNQSGMCANGADRGSAIVGVLVATVFLGIVAASMFRSTGSQSAASRGYGYVHVASSTINSAMIASRVFLASAAGTEAAQGIVQKYVDGGEPAGTEAYLLHDNGRKRYLVSAAVTPDQMYSSSIDRVVPHNNSEIFAALRVKSGKSAVRDVREALVFGVLGNVELVQQELPQSAGGNNAIFVAGSTNCISNQEIEVRSGSITYMNDLIHQRNITVVEGDAWVRGNALRGANNSITSISLSARDGVTTNKEPPESRLERPLDMSVVPGGVAVRYKNHNGASVFTNNSASSAGPVRYTFDQNPGNISVRDLDSMYAHAERGGRLHSGHLVVELNDNVNFNFNNATFDKKVIFVVNTKWQIGNFYNSGANASTLIHVAAGGQLDQLTLPGGAFRGLIHVAAENKLNQRIQGGGEFRGALHMMGSGTFEWNTGNPSKTTVTYDLGLLNGFGIPRVGDGHNAGAGDGNNADGASPVLVTVPAGRTIDFRPFGYYYF